MTDVQLKKSWSCGHVRSGWMPELAPYRSVMVTCSKGSLQTAFTEV
jgi:hypothetical protein